MPRALINVLIDFNDPITEQFHREHLEFFF